MKNKNKIKKVILNLIVFIIYLVFGIASFPNKKSVSNFNVMYFAISLIFTSIIIAFIYKDDLKKEFSSFRKDTKKNLLGCFKVFIILFLITIFSNFIIDKLIGWTKIGTDSLIFPNMSSIAIYTILVLCIYMPFSEGIIFTKTINNIFDIKRFWPIISGVIYGIMQAGFKFNNMVFLASKIPYIIIGIIVAKVYDKNKNVFYPIFIWLFYYVFQLLIQSSAYWL